MDLGRLKELASSVEPTLAEAVHEKASFEFWYAAREAVPALISRIEALEARNRRLVALMARAHRELHDDCGGCKTCRAIFNDMGQALDAEDGEPKVKSDLSKWEYCPRSAGVASPFAKPTEDGKCPWCKRALEEEGIDA